MKTTAFPIIEVKRDLFDAIAVTYQGAAGTFTHAYQEIRAGLAWPLRGCPAYFCLIGRLMGCKITDKNSLVFILEDQHETARAALEALLNTCKEFRFGSIYTDRQLMEWIGFNAELDSYVRGRPDMADIRLQHVPFANDFRLGLDCIQTLGRNGALVIPPQTRVLSQLETIRPDDLMIDRPDYKFYAINALRFVMTAYTKMGRGGNVHSPASPGINRPQVRIPA